jgi:hypothetical protein
MPGVSVASVSSKSFRTDIIKSMRGAGLPYGGTVGASGYYHGQYVSIVRGQKGSYGTDPGEKIISKAEVSRRYVKATETTQSAKPTKSEVRAESRFNPDARTGSARYTATPQTYSKISDVAKTFKPGRFLPVVVGVSVLGSIIGDAVKSQSEASPSYTKKDRSSYVKADGSQGKELSKAQAEYHRGRRGKGV